MNPSSSSSSISDQSKLLQESLQVVQVQSFHFKKLLVKFSIYFTGKP